MPNANRMMIAFITINSDLVLLIQGLFTQILYFRFEIIGGLRHGSHLLVFFFGRKNMFKKKAVSPISHPASIYIHVYFVTHVRIYVCRYFFKSIWSLRALQVSHPDSWAHIRVPHLCNVCVCAYTHTVSKYAR